MKNNQKCKFGVYKYCMDCERSFVDTVWCGDLLCNRCLEMCWLVDNTEIAERILGCCDYHRPYISLSNVKSTPNKINQTDGIISKSNDMEFDTPLGNFKSFHNKLPPKSDNISIPTKEKDDIKHTNTESKSLPLNTRKSHAYEQYYSRTSTPVNTNTPLTSTSSTTPKASTSSTSSTSINDSFFSVDFFSKLLKKNK